MRIDREKIIRELLLGTGKIGKFHFTRQFMGVCSGTVYNYDRKKLKSYFKRDIKMSRSNSNFPQETLHLGVMLRRSTVLCLRSG